MKVLLTDSVDMKARDILKSAGIEADVRPTMLEEELKEAIASYDAILVRSATKLNASVIERAENLRIIGRAGVGLDNIDLDAAKKMGIEVVNSPSGNSNAVAEHVIGLIFSLARNIHGAHSHVKAGGWEKKLFKGTEVREKKLGVIGLGRIGRLVSSAAAGLGMEVIGYDPYVKEEGVKGTAISLESIENLMRNSDFITIHVPLTDGTRSMIGKKELAMMKDGVMIINAARGGIIDEDALYDAITSGKVAGAALDVWKDEPPHESMLLKLDEVLATPHVGGNTHEAQVNVAVDVAEKIVKFFKDI